MMLSQLVDEDHIIFLLDKYEKEELLYTLTRKLCELEHIDQVDSIYKQLIDRENLGSTSLGNELAIPHARVVFIDKPCVLIAITHNGVDYDSTHKDLIKIIFLLLTPEKALNLHLNLLSQISKIMYKDNIKSKILNANTANEVLQILKEVEQNNV